MTEPEATNADLEALGVALQPFASPPSVEDAPAFIELFARIHAVCAARGESEEAIELLGAYAKHPELFDGGAITGEFRQAEAVRELLEACLSADDGDRRSSAPFAALLHAVERLSDARLAE